MRYADGKRERWERKREEESWTGEAYGVQGWWQQGVTEKTAGVRMAKRGKVEGCDLRGLDRSRLRQNRAA